MSKGVSQNCRAIILGSNGPEDHVIRLGQVQTYPKSQSTYINVNASDMSSIHYLSSSPSEFAKTQMVVSSMVGCL